MSTSGNDNDAVRHQNNPGQVVTCPLSELRAHPSYLRLQLTVPTSTLSALAAQGELAFREPLAITSERVVIDGYARWRLARLTGRQTVPCVEYNLTEEQSLRWLLQKHRRSNGMNDFCRILLALELEPCLKEKAVSNQRLGGRLKGSSNLTEDAAVDVRKDVAAAAGVSVGNVTKVKQLLKAGHPEMLEVLRGGEISIHRAWKWNTKPPNQQIGALRTYRSKMGVNKAIRHLISRHEPRNAPVEPDLNSLVSRLSQLSSGQCESVRVCVIRTPGKMVFVTEDLMQSLRPYQETIPTCIADNH